MAKYDVVIIGAGAAGLFCGIEAARRGRRVLVIDHNKKPAEKVRISGGGRCNFSNLDIRPERFLSQNPKFAISALRRYSQWDFIERVADAGIAYHEKTLGQLFCDGSSQEIIDLLLSDLKSAGGALWLSCAVETIDSSNGFLVNTSNGVVEADAVVLATGGKSIPKMGASDFGYRVAHQFGHQIVETRAGLVPLTFSGDVLEQTKALSGVAVESTVGCGKTSFAEGMLFTHRGLSGPSILQISSYWREGRDIEIDLLHGANIERLLSADKSNHGATSIRNGLARHVPKALADGVVSELGMNGNLGDLSKADLARIGERVHHWRVLPQGTEGYRTAEVTLGGVDTDGLDARTMESKHQKGLYIIGELVDVTGWLGGYNFQWAWSSGWAAGQVA